jgi:hypothetical protein
MLESDTIEEISASSSSLSSESEITTTSLEDLVKLVSARLFISPPLDEDIKTESFDSSSSIAPAGLLEQLIVTGVVMTYMGQHGKLYTP